MKPAKLPPPNSVEEYFSRLPPHSRAILLRLRNVIKDAAPEAEEVISYQIPAFRFHGVLVYYAAFEDHCSLFVASAAVRKRFAQYLRPFAGGKGTVRLTRELPLPDTLVRRIVRARMDENERKWKKKEAALGSGVNPKPCTTRVTAPSQ
jgi:uncharacterized protein YdhG (YjbR/CyaY superfamily)